MIVLSQIASGRWFVSNYYNLYVDGAEGRIASASSGHERMMIRCLREHVNFVVRCFRKAA